MIQALTILLLFQLAGEVITLMLALPIPGPVIGMLLLFCALLLRGNLSPTLNETARGLLAHLSLLFVPAGVGVMAHFALLQSEWLAILLILVGSTLVALAITALSMRLVLHAAQKPQ